MRCNPHLPLGKRWLWNYFLMRRILTSTWTPSATTTKRPTTRSRRRRRTSTCPSPSSSRPATRSTRRVISRFVATWIWFQPENECWVFIIMKKQHLTVVEWDIVSFLAKGSVVKRTKHLLLMQEDLDTIQQIFLLGIRWSENGTSRTRWFCFLAGWISWKKW